MMKPSLKKYFEEVKCNLCGKNNYKIIYKDKYTDSVTKKDLLEEFKAAVDVGTIEQVVKCKNCGLIYNNPRIKEEIILKGYSEGANIEHVGQAKGREITFAKQLKLINKYKPNKGKILDIGTAGGSFLYVAKKDGWDVHGVEPNKWMAEWGKEHYGIPIKPGDIFANKFPDKTFDVVTLWDVLEHVPDPTKTLNEINRILKPKGILVVNYPDIGSWIARILKRKWMLLLSIHLYYFTPKTIKSILNKNGFKTLKIKPHWQSLSFGYLIFRTGEFSKALQKLGKLMIKVLGWKDKQVSYWIGQSLVIARKK